MLKLHTCNDVLGDSTSSWLDKSTSAFPHWCYINVLLQYEALPLRKPHLNNMSCLLVCCCHMFVPHSN